MGFRGRTPAGSRGSGTPFTGFSGRSNLGSQSGTFRVSQNKQGQVSITKIPPKKRHKPGYRMPRVVREQLDAQRRMVEAVTYRIFSEHAK